MPDEENVSHEKETSETKETTQENTQVDRPEYVPEKFWDTNTNSVNIESMASSYNALEKKLGSRTEDLSKSIREDIANEQKANVPEKYEVKPPEDLPEDVDFQVSDGQPILEWWKEFARERGLNQSEFDKGIDAFVKNELSNTPDPNEEMRKLGDASKERIETANVWAKKYLSSEAYDTVRGLSSTAEGVKAIEEIMNLNKDAPLPKQSAIEVAPDPVDLRSMMADPRYWKDGEKDQAYIARVTQLYEKTFDKKQ